MAKDINTIILVGRLTKDADIRFTTSKQKCAKFTLASSDDYKKDGETVKKTNFINCEAYSGTADIVERYTSKGKQVCVIGKLFVREWEKDGNRQYYTGVTVSEVQLFGNGQKAEQNDGSVGKNNNMSASLRDEQGYADEFPLDFSELGDIEAPGDIQIPF